MNSVIVVFNEGTPESVLSEEEERVVASGGKIGHRYRDTMLGFSASIPDDHLGKYNTNFQQLFQLTKR